MGKFKFKLNDIVEFRMGLLHGSGRVKGVVTAEQPVVGMTYIVEVINYFDKNFDYEDYPFSSIGCFESGMKLMHSAEPNEIRDQFIGYAADIEEHRQHSTGCVLFYLDNYTNGHRCIHLVTVGQHEVKMGGEVFARYIWEENVPFFKFYGDNATEWSVRQERLREHLVRAINEERIKREKINK